MQDKNIFEQLLAAAHDGIGASSIDAPSFETFLVEEGLDVLASYRSIANPRLRKSIRDLIAMIAAEDDAQRADRSEVNGGKGLEDGPRRASSNLFPGPTP